MSWTGGNHYLTQAQMEGNAIEIYQYLASYGWTINAISAVLGNMQSESGINPGIWENLTPYAGGYGLVQWTPYSKYKNWAGSQWENNGPLECARIVYEFNNGLQWQNDTLTWPQYIYNQSDFPTSTESPEFLAWVWLQNYERPGNFNQPERATQAAWWYTYLTGEDPPVPPEPVPPPPGAGKLPLWMLFKFTERRIK